MSQGILEQLAATATDALVAVLPLAGLFLLFQPRVLRLDRPATLRILFGLGVAAAGLFVFLVGVTVAYIPFGRAIGEALAELDGDWLLAGIGVLLGLVTAFGEPAVRILAEQVEEASAGSISRGVVLAAICAGVAAAVAIGLLRVAHGIPLLYLVVPGYGLIIAMLWLGDRDFAGIAVDAGGVATGPLTNTFLLAVALGASAGFGNENPVVSGFGIAAIIAVAPTLTLMALGIVVRRKKRHGGKQP